VPLTEETKGMISYEEFEIMKNGVYIINTSRVELLMKKLFLKSLEDGKVKSAYLDVYFPTSFWK